MARPTKQGIDYFPLDCQFDNNIEMLLIEKGANGLAVLISIWQMIYSNEGYYILDNKDLHLLIKRKIGVDINDVSDCINVCLSRNIFSEKLHKKHKILTSRATQKRYFDAAKKKKGVNVNKELLLIDVSVYENLVYSNANGDKSSGNATKEEVDVKVNIKEKVDSIFSFWKETWKHPRSVMDDKRKKLITTALKNYSVEDLKLAITGCSKTPHNIGKNDNSQIYDGLHIILKDSDNIERFIGNAGLSINQGNGPHRKQLSNGEA